MKGREVKGREVKGREVKGREVKGYIHINKHAYIYYFMIR